MYQKLKQFRTEKGLTLKEMSQILGYSSPNAYSRKEKGERRITVEEAKIIAKILNKSMDEIFLE